MIYLLKAAIMIEVVLLVAVALFRSCLHPRHRRLVGAGDVALVAAIPLVGLFGHDKNVFYAFLFVMPLFWSGDPTRLATRYVLALVSFPELSAPYIVGGLYLGFASALIALNAGALVALGIARGRSLRPVRPLDIALWLVFLVAILLSARGMPPLAAARMVATTFLLVVPPYFVVARAVRSPAAAGDVAGFLVLGGVCNAGIGLVEGVKHWSLYESILGALHVQAAHMSANLAVRAGYLRAGGAFVNYEMLGLLCGLSLLAAVSIRRRFTPPGFVAIVVALAAGMLASQARSAWIATAVGLLLQAAYDRRWTLVAALAGGGGAVGAALYAASSSSRIGQLVGASGHGESTGDYRQRLLDRGLEEARLHPLTGQTLDQLQVSMNDLRQGEQIIDFVNTHLFVVLVGGIGALLAWLVAWGIPLALAWRRRPARRIGAEPAPLALPFAFLCTVALFLAFTSPVDRALPFAAIGMALTGLGMRLPALAATPAAAARRRPPLVVGIPVAPR